MPTHSCTCEHGLSLFYKVICLAMGKQPPEEAQEFAAIQDSCWSRSNMDMLRFPRNQHQASNTGFWGSWNYLSRQPSRCPKGVSILKEILKQSLWWAVIQGALSFQRLLLLMAGTVMWEQPGEVIWLTTSLCGVQSRAEMLFINSSSLSFALLIVSRIWNILSHTVSFDSDTTLLEVDVAMVQYGCKIRKRKKKDKNPSIKWISRFAVDQKTFRGVLMNIQAKAGIASLEKQIRIVQERARPNGLATHLGVLSSVELLI